MSEIVKATCPECKRAIRVPAEWAGKKVRCRHCGAAIRPVVDSVATAPTVGSSQAPPVSSPSKSPAPKTPPTVVPPVTSSPIVTPPANSSSKSPSQKVPLPVEADDSPEPIIRLTPRPPKSRALKWIRAGVTAGLAILGVVLVVLNWDHFQLLGQNVRDAIEERADLNKSPKDSSPPKADPVKVAGPVFPRRLLAIFPSQYLYANRVSPGTFDRSFASLLQKLSYGFHIDTSQMLVLSDEATETSSIGSKTDKNKPKPALAVASFTKILPTRALVEKACAEFLTTSRPQDRVLILFIGHIVTLDDKNFLAGLDGDLSDKSTLISLDWLYEKLAQCKARQKVLVVDTCRLDPGRGIDRPASGPMSAALAGALEKPPAGVEVWAPCHAEQYSFEVDGQSVFLEKLCEALESGSWVAGDKPENELPLSAIRETVQAKLNKELSKSLKVKQATLWAGKPPEQAAGYDAQESVPEPMKLTEAQPPGPPADPKAVRQILSELKLPPIQASLADEEKLDIDGAVYFARDKLTPYLPDYQSLDEIRRQAAKFPLRVAVLDTLKFLENEFGAGRTSGALRQFYPAAGDQDAKNRILTEQKKPAQVLLRLQEQRAKLEKAGEAREEEKSKRWQANFDYTLAELLARIAFMEEYNLMLGRIRKDELPELEKGVDEGWRLVPREKVQSPKDVRDLATQSHKLFVKVAKDHAGTPWEVLARRAAGASLGLQWQPAKR